LLSKIDGRRIRLTRDPSTLTGRCRTAFAVAQTQHYRRAVVALLL